MKWINNFEPLKIKQVNDKDVEIKKYCEDVWIIKEENREYLMIKRNFKNNFKRNMDEVIIKDNAEIEVKTNCNDKKQSLYLDYGAEGSIIIDMNGIDNFRFAESEVFNDYTIRKIVKKMNLLAEGEYLRIGASGARKNGNHPGGEVFEYSLIQNNKCEGLSQNVSGYLPKNECYSRSIPLFEDDEKTLREERIVYSHTAWLKKGDFTDSKSVYMKVRPKKSEESLLDILNQVASELGINCFSIQIFVKSQKENDTEVNGRVLKHMPEKPFKDIPEVVEISYEKRFKLEQSDKMYGMGTKYERYEPEWTEFTNGGKYERRGHIHGTIISSIKTNNKKHQTFHLRDVFISQTSNVEFVLTPIDTIYRIYPIHKKNNIYICDASKKKIDELIKNIKSIDDKG